jgi:hypothetical protein
MIARWKLDRRKSCPRPDLQHRYRRPFEGTEASRDAMQAYLDWEYGLVEQLKRDRHARLLRDLRRPVVLFVINA